jgi:arylsulfatase A-like enzyme
METERPSSIRRPVVAFALWLCAIGCLDGAIMAVRQIAAQHYIAQGLWRTALWHVCRVSLTGALIGGAAGLALLASLLVWPGTVSIVRRLLDLGPRAVSTSVFISSALPFALFFGLCSGVALLLLPADVPTQVPPYEVFAVACFAGLWIVASGAAAWTVPGPSRDGLSADSFRLRWLTVVGLAYVTFLLRFRVDPPAGGFPLAAGIGFCASAVAYTVLYRPARLVNEGARARLGPLRRGFASPWFPLALVLAASSLWIAGRVTWAQARARSAEQGRNILVISVDTLRADRASLLSADEHQRDLTPNVREMLAGRGTVFTSAISQAPWTLPAFASIFTGLYPEQHGADRLTGRLAPGQITLAELLREHGFYTGAVVSGEFVGSEVGMDQGFASFDESQVPVGVGITSWQVSERALRFLGAHAERPFFLFLHYFDPHLPYRDQPDFHFADSYAGWLRAEAEVVDQLMLFQFKKHLLGPLEREFITDLYDEEVAYTDAQIGRVLGFLDEAGLWDATLVVFVADHGEEFLEHGSVGHANTLYQECIHVPLAIVDPMHEAPATFTRPVETRWLFRTVLDFLGLEPPEDRADLPSLTHDSLSGREEHLVRSSTHPAQSPIDEATSPGAHVWLSSLVDERWKLIVDHNLGRSMLFDLGSDAGEQDDQLERRPEIGARLSAALQRVDSALDRAPRDPSGPGPSEEHLRRLRDLGYL